MAGLSVIFRRTLVASTLTAPVNSSPVPCPTSEFVGHTSPLRTDTTLPMTSPLSPSTPSRPKGPRPRLATTAAPKSHCPSSAPWRSPTSPDHQALPSPVQSRSCSVLPSPARGCSSPVFSASPPLTQPAYQAPPPAHSSPSPASPSPPSSRPLLPPADPPPPVTHRPLCKTRLTPLPTAPPTPRQLH